MCERELLCDRVLIDVELFDRYVVPPKIMGADEALVTSTLVIAFQSTVTLQSRRCKCAGLSLTVSWTPLSYFLARLSSLASDTKGLMSLPLGPWVRICLHPSGTQYADSFARFSQ